MTNDHACVFSSTATKALGAHEQDFRRAVSHVFTVKPMADRLLQAASMAWIVKAFLRVLLLSIVLVNLGVQSEMEGTLLFLHVWKCGGTTLRQLMCDWANREGLPCATVAACRRLSLKVNLLHFLSYTVYRNVACVLCL